MRIALKFGYDGLKFWGYQRQPDVRTVEGEILRAMRKTKMIRSVEGNNFRSSSRTDRGASAIGNVLAFDTDFRKKEILRALNSNLENVYFWGIAEVDDDFNPRHAEQRWYRYHLSKELDLRRLRAASDLFVGEHDFKNFCRKSERSSIRKIDSIKLTRRRNFIHFDIKAQSFLWNMVRRIVSAIVEYEEGVVTKKAIDGALAGKTRDLGLASATPLFLMDVSYGFGFETHPSSLPSSLAMSHERVLIQEELYTDLAKVIE